jgi:hypothetical protein
MMTINSWNYIPCTCPKCGPVKAVKVSRDNKSWIACPVCKQPLHTLWLRDNYTFKYGVFPSTVLRTPDLAIAAAMAFAKDALDLAPYMYQLKKERAAYEAFYRSDNKSWIKAAPAAPATHKPLLPREDNPATVQVEEPQARLRKITLAIPEVARTGKMRPPVFTREIAPGEYELVCRCPKCDGVVPVQAKYRSGVIYLMDEAGHIARQARKDEIEILDAVVPEPAYCGAL